MCTNKPPVPCSCSHDEREVAHLSGVHLHMGGNFFLWLEGTYAPQLGAGKEKTLLIGVLSQENPFHSSISSEFEECMHMHPFFSNCQDRDWNRRWACGSWLPVRSASASCYRASLQATFSIFITWDHIFTNFANPPSYRKPCRWSPLRNMLPTYLEMVSKHAESLSYLSKLHHLS